MKTGGITLAIAAFAWSACEKSASPPEAKSIAQTVAVDESDGTTLARRNDLQELSSERERLMKETALEASQIEEIQWDISDRKQSLAEIQKRLKDLSAMKRQMQAETEKLKAEWELELEGFGEGYPAPVIETHRGDLAKIAELLEENKALKKKLAEAGK